MALDKQRARGGRIAARITGRGGEELPEADDHTPQRKNKGLGRIIIAVYAVFALSAFARSLFQLLTEFDVAPLAFTLSAIAAVVYIVATISLALPSRRAWFVAMGAVVLELFGIVAVSILSYAAPELFLRASVWSHFGQGYGYVPFVLPFFGLWWLLSHRPREGSRAGGRG